MASSVCGHQTEYPWGARPFPWFFLRFEFSLIYIEIRWTFLFFFFFFFFFFLGGGWGVAWSRIFPISLFAVHPAIGSDNSRRHKTIFETRENKLESKLESKYNIFHFIKCFRASCLNFYSDPNVLRVCVVWPSFNDVDDFNLSIGK